MIKRFICIITIIAVLASSLCLSAFASQYPADPMDEAARVNGVWSRNTSYGPRYARFTAYQSDLFGSIAGWIEGFLNRWQFVGGFPSEQFFDVYVPDSNLSISYSFYVKGMLEVNAAYPPESLNNGRMAVGKDELWNAWNDGTRVDFETLSAMSDYLNKNGFITNLCYINCRTVYSSTRTDLYGAWFLCFNGAWSGGWTDSLGYPYQWYVLCDFEGSPICCDITANGSVGDQSSPSTDRPHYTEPTTPSVPDEPSDVVEGPTSDNPLITVIDGVTYYWDLRTLTYIPIDSLNYDASQYLYWFDYRDQSTTVNITYNIDYTQITYIGASEEYEGYKYYYELPDGRSSADMTAEDLEQLNLSYDVINYGKSADDGRLRSLYHLDGNTEDSSYWVNDTSFTWDVNPSIEYLEATNFEGCLYLDEQDHKFTLKLPSNLSASDFSLMFRYYHYGYGDTENNTATNYTDLVVHSTNSTVQNAYSTLFTNLAGTLTTNSTTPIGVWSEVAIIRDGAMLYTYVNGLVIDSKAFVDVLGDQLVFDFKDVAVRRQIDEIRVFNYAMYEAGESYTPITVPMDTNLVLILPDEATPLPDAYWDFNTDGNLFVKQDFTNGDLGLTTYNRGLGNDPWTLGAQLSPIYINTEVGREYWFYPRNYFGSADSPDGGSTIYSNYVHLNGIPTSIVSGERSYYDGRDLVVSTPYDSPGNIHIGAKLPFSVGTGDNVLGLVYSKDAFPAYHYPAAVINNNSSATVNPYNIQAGNTYSFSVVTADGNQTSVTGTVPTLSGDWLFNEPYVVVEEGSSCYIGFVIMPWTLNTASNRSSKVVFDIFISPKEGGMDIVYMEFKEGEPNDNTDAYKTVIYNESEIEPNTIAIRTTVPVRSWRIGGVRPTLPYKGDVWLMVQDERVTSSQIYNGYMWVACDIRIWTGERWAWPNYFNILTQQDMTDIKGTTDNVYIQDTDGYYSWITEQWKALLDLLNTMATLLSEIDGGGDVNIDLDFNFDGTISIEFITSMEKSRDGMFLILQEFWDGLFNPAFEGLSSGTTSFIDLFNPDNTTVTINGETVYTPGGLLGKEYDFEV